jgi:subtilisin family serine protease
MWIPLLTVGAMIAGAADQEVLVDRSRLAALKPYQGDLPAAFVGAEIEDQPEASSYVLFGVTVPPGGWEVEAVTVYFKSAAAPQDGKPLSTTGRLNLFRREGRSEQPRPADDPRKGRIVAIVVNPRDGFNEVRAERLAIRLGPGEYWLGLTPVCRLDSRGTRLMIRAEGHAAEAIEPAVYFPEGAEAALGRPGQWNTLPEALRTTFDGDIALKVEGRRLPRGRVVDVAPLSITTDRRIRLRVGAFDPLAQVPDVPPDLAAPAASRVAIVQLRATPDQAVRARLAELGVELLGYIPEDAYLIECSPEVRMKLAASPEIRWVGPFHPAYKIAPGMLDRAAGGGDMPGGPVPCHILVFDQGTASRKEVVSLIEREGGTADAVRIPDPVGRSHRLMPVRPRKYRVTAELTESLIRALARCDSVSSIEPYRGVARGDRTGPPAGEATGAGAVTPGDVRALFGADHVEANGGYRGAGVRGAVIDTDVRDDHVDLVSRPIFYAVPRVGGNPFHGTATAGILFGDGTGNPRVKGILPQGLLVLAAAPMPSTDHYGLAAGRSAIAGLTPRPPRRS